MEPGAESPNVRRALALVGQVVAERYRVDGVLGEGGMGTVLKATHLLLKQPVALKVMTEEAMPDPDLRARFLREARILSELKSPHIASLYDVGVLPDGSLYLAMEYLEGRDLSEVAENAIAPRRAVDFGMQICEGLAEAHEKGVVHRDLKPSNVFVTQKADGREVLKLIDFGIAKQQKDNEALGRTKTNLMMGSPYYMSPEQIVSSKTVDHRADIWSFGVLMFQLLSGLLPFYDESVGAILIRVHNQPTPALPPHVPLELASVVYRCLAKDKNQRFSSAREIIAALAPLSTIPNRLPPSDHLRAVEAAPHPVPQRSPAPLMVPGPELYAMPLGEPRAQGVLQHIDVPRMSLEANVPRMSLEANVPRMSLEATEGPQRRDTPDPGPGLGDRSSSGPYPAYSHASSGAFPSATVGGGLDPSGASRASSSALRGSYGPGDPTTDAAVAFAPTLPPPPHPNQRGLWVAVVTLGVAVSLLAVALVVSRAPSSHGNDAPKDNGTPLGSTAPTAAPTAFPTPSASTSSSVTASPTASVVPSTPPTTTASAASSAPSTRPSSTGKHGVPKPPPTKDPLAP